ncbi:serine hydrolase domain-containing protein [Actinosynnema sp. NPDC023658]|uniref:serine hydrolase domain-containing protein n=1 Tax=Actinosynnema sp. NPDC023658 TaxID=3155465 RepID=UPI0033F886D0
MSRRDFGRVVALAGAAGGAVLSGLSTAPAANAADLSWTMRGPIGNGLSGFDDAMRNFMQPRGIAAGSLAVVRNGKLVLARGYSYSADPAVQTQPTSLFRIASISKPITATAVLRLVQEGRLSLTARVTDLLGLTPTDPDLRQVTVLNLLQHRGGFQTSPDPMFSDYEIKSAFGLRLPIGQADIVRYVAGKELATSPGAEYHYSNFGYLLLGRVIERVTGQPYDTYVRQAVLAPKGITRMRQGRSLPQYRASGEVSYQSGITASTVMDDSGAVVPIQYGGFNLENMAAHGAWLSTSVDLVRFASIYDGPNSVLDAASINQAFAVPAAETGSPSWYYGCGWAVVLPGGGVRNTYHDGSLPGTTTFLVRRYDGVTWAVLFTKRAESSGDPDYSAIDYDLHVAADNAAWPTVDYYPGYGF